MRLPIALALTLAFTSPAVAADKPADQPHWTRMSDGDRGAAGTLAERYMRFLGTARVPVQRVRYLVDRAAEGGFKPFGSNSGWSPGARYTLVNRDRSMMLVVAGRKPLKEGVRLIGAHLDSPRLELRAKPIRTADNMVMLMTAPYGGIKRYQWANLPLALVGQMARADGKVVDVSIGDRPGDPVFVIPDTAPHVDKDLRTRTADAVFKGDELGPVVASLGKQGLMDELKHRYNVTEEDFVSSELSFVPAGAPREVGFDRQLIGSYGQDDGLCSFVAAHALIAMGGTPEYTSLVYLVDHEEVGNTNTTGVKSRFLESTLERLIAREGKGKGSPVDIDSLSQVFENSQALSADVSHALNPLFPSTEDAANTAKVGYGMTVKSMKPGSDGSPSLRGKMRGLLTKHKVAWQTYAYKVDGGGGSTIGADMQELNLDVVDVGVPLLAMHGTLEMAAKADVYALDRFFTAFLKGD